MDGNHGETHPKGNDFTVTGIPFVMASDINNGVIGFGECKYITKEQADGLRKGFSLEGDVLLSHKATIGRTAIVPRTEFPYLMLTPQVTYYRVLDKKVLDSRFLKYYFDSSSFQKTLGLWAGAGSTRAYLGITGQKYLPVRIPDINTQRQVADVLSAIDKKIELNNKINAELEAMAKLIYDYWFVQFDFPDANGKPYKSSGGKMVYNETLKREIPDGWEVAYFGECVAVRKGELITKKTVKEGEVKVVAAGLNFSYYHSTSNYQKNTITVSGSGASAGFVNFWREPIFASDCITVRGSTDAETVLALQYLRLIQSYIFKQARGSAQPHVYPNDISGLKYLVAPTGLIEEFGNKVLSANEKIAVNDRENENLTDLRDWLLPMLMNGQVTVKDS